MGKIKIIIDFIKKYWKYFKYVFLIFAVITVLVYAICRERKIANYAAENTELVLRINFLQDQRDSVVLENDGLIKEQLKINHEKDSIITIQDRLKKDMEYLIAKHKKEIDSLLNIPDDAVFLRLQPIFPNYDGGSLKYAFSGSQIKQIYSTAISFPMLQQEYRLQTKQLLNCNNLNKTYEASENNYRDQVNNLNRQISICDQQIGLKDSELKITQKQLSRKTFWNWTEKGALIVLGTLFVFK